MGWAQPSMGRVRPNPSCVRPTSGRVRANPGQIEPGLGQCLPMFGQLWPRVGQIAALNPRCGSEAKHPGPPDIPTQAVESEAQDAVELEGLEGLRGHLNGEDHVHLNAKLLLGAGVAVNAGWSNEAAAWGVVRGSGRSLEVDGASPRSGAKSGERERGGALPGCGTLRANSTSETLARSTCGGRKQQARSPKLVSPRDLLTESDSPRSELYQERVSARGALDTKAPDVTRSCVAPVFRRGRWADSVRDGESRLRPNPKSLVAPLIVQLRALHFRIRSELRPFRTARKRTDATGAGASEGSRVWAGDPVAQDRLGILNGNLVKSRAGVV